MILKRKYYNLNLTGVIVFLLLAIFNSCSNGIADDLNNKAGKITLQPIGYFDTLQLKALQKDLAAFYKSPVEILGKIPVPRNYINLSKGERYCADSIIDFLSTKTGSFSKIVGLTHKDIYTTIYENGKVKDPAYKYAVWGIFGLGFCPGNACIISDFRLKSDKGKLYKRLKTVVIHELGHNLGLLHCENNKCIMNDANEKITSVDNSSDDYCEKCRNILNSME